MERNTLPDYDHTPKTEWANFQGVNRDQAECVKSLLFSHTPGGVNRYFTEVDIDYDENEQLLAVSVVAHPGLYEPALDIVARAVLSAKKHVSDSHAA